MTTKAVAGSLVATFVLGFIVLLAGPAQASCTLGAYKPGRFGNNVNGHGGRGDNCGGSFVVYLRKQRNNMPDINIASLSANCPKCELFPTTVHVDPLTARSRVEGSSGAVAESAWVSSL